MSFPIHFMQWEQAPIPTFTKLGEEPLPGEKYGPRPVALCGDKNAHVLHMTTDTGCVTCEVCLTIMAHQVEQTVIGDQLNEHTARRCSACNGEGRAIVAGKRRQCLYCRGLGFTVEVP